jgi:CheY-like chemotaxis protein
MDKTPVSILIIDGDSASRNYLSSMLRKSGYEVLTAALGREGLISAWKDQPGVIIFDPFLPDLPGLNLLTRLRQDRRTAKVPCVALSSRENLQEAAGLLEAGCNEYLAKSGQAVQQLLELLPRLIEGKPAVPRKRGMQIVFLSAKGGTGTSSLCANIAMCIGSGKDAPQMGVVDMVLPIGSIADIVGYKDRLNLVTASVQNPAQLTAAYFKENLPLLAAWHFHLLAGSPDPEAANQLDIKRLDTILAAMLEAHDYVFVDLGRSLSRISLPIIQRADVIVVVVGTDLSTAILTQTVLEYLKNQGVDPLRLYPLQNRAVGLEGLTKVEVEKIIGREIHLTMPHLGGNLTIANNRHEPFLAKFQNDSAAFNLRQAAREILELGQRIRSRQ